MSTFLGILLALLALVTLIVIHEFGHFIAAKIFNVYVNEFSIGFGPLIFSKKRKTGETKFSIRWIPLGGYCSMIGEDIPEMTEEEVASLSPSDQELYSLYKTLPPNRKLNGISRWKRCIILLAGITLNFIVGYLLFFFYAIDVPVVYSYENYVQVQENSLASEAGWTNEDIIIGGEYIVTIDNVETESQPFEILSDSPEDKLQLYYAFNEALNQAPSTVNDNVVFNLNTLDEELIELTVPAIDNNGTLSWESIGISFVPITRRTTPSEWFTISGRMFGEGCGAIFVALGQIFTPEGFSNLGGIISIVQVSTMASSIGAYYFFGVWALVSVNLAIFNLLPFPGLDGWQFVVTIIEGITKKEIPSKFKTIMTYIGFGLLLTLFVVVTFKDIFALF